MKRGEIRCLYDELIAVKPERPIDAFGRLREAMRRTAHLVTTDRRLSMSIKPFWVTGRMVFNVEGNLSVNGQLIPKVVQVSDIDVATVSVCPLTLALGEVIRSLYVAAGELDEERAMKGLERRDVSRLRSKGMLLKRDHYKYRKDGVAKDG